MSEVLLLAVTGVVLLGLWQSLKFTFALMDAQRSERLRGGASPVREKES